MTKEATRTIEIFCSYAHEDEPLRKELEKHLTILKRQGLITSWYDRKIMAGAEWAHAIDTHLNTAQIILLLISADFLASDYCYHIEVRQALKRHAAGEAYVIPVILRPVDWENAPFGKLLALPTNGKPITSWSGRQGRDKAFLDVAIGIRETILLIKKQWPGEKSTEKAAQDYGEASASIDASIALVQTQQADTLYELNRYDEALMDYTQAVHLDPDYALAYRGMGETLYKLGRYKEALAAYEQALQLDPNDVSTYRNEGAALYKLGRYEEALAAYEQILRLDPKDSGANYNEGAVLYKLKRYVEALAAYNRMLFRNPNNASAYYNKGNVFYKLKRYEEALAAYEQALQLDPNNSEAYQGKGQILQHLKRSKEAQQAYQKAQQLRNQASPAKIELIE